MLTLSMLFAAGSCGDGCLMGRFPPEPFLGLLAPLPASTPAKEGCSCCGCGWIGCWAGVGWGGCWSRGRPGDIPPGVATPVGDWLFWIWLEMNEKLSGTQLLLLAMLLFSGWPAIPEGQTNCQSQKLVRFKHAWMSLHGKHVYVTFVCNSRWKNIKVIKMIE